MDSRAWRGYVLAGASVVAGYLLVPGGLRRDGIYVLVGVSSALAIALSVRLHRPPRAAPWWLLAAGQLLWSVGDATYAWQFQVRDALPFPGPADALYLSAYVLFGTAFLLLLQGRQAHRDRDGFLDSAIFTVGFGLLSWVFIVKPGVFASDDSSLAERAIGLAYPLADVMLFALLVRLLTTPAGRTPAFRLLIAGGALLVVADSAYARLALASSYDGGAVDLLWLAAYVAWGAAALHPSMRRLSEPVPDARAAFTRRRLLALTAATLTAPATLAVQLLLGPSLDGWAVVVGSVLLSGLVITRMSGLLQRIQTQAGELEALSRTDDLTGLPNRRSGDAELGRALVQASRTGEALCLAIIDLDRFKVYNDTHGHQAGDQLLAQAATAWAAQLGGRGVLSRYGGEEFVLLCPRLPVDDAEQLLEELRGLTPAGQTFSAGAAGWDGLEGCESLVHRADVALYAAKQAGRNRTSVAAVANNAAGTSASLLGGR